MYQELTERVTIFTAGCKHEQFYRAERLFQLSETIGSQSYQRPSVVGDPAGSGSKETRQTQRGQSPEGQTRPSEVSALRARQDPAWSKVSGQDKTQRGGPDKTQRGQGPSVVPEGQTRPSEVRALRARDPAWSEPRGPQQTQRGQRPEGQTRPSEVRGPEWSEPKEARQTQRGQSPPCL